MKILVYGTLRKGMDNFDRFDLTYLETVVIHGYKLFVIPGGDFDLPLAYPDEDSELVCDIVEVNKLRDVQDIDRMETMSGYYIDTEIIEERALKIYPYISKRDRAIEIPDGDFVKWKENK